MKLPVYVTLLAESESTLAPSFRQVADAHGDEPDIHFICVTLAQQCEKHRERLDEVIERIGRSIADDEPERLHAGALEEPRSGPLGVLRDLQDLCLLASLTDVTWTVVKQAAQALMDGAPVGDHRGLPAGDLRSTALAARPDEAGRPASPDRSDPSMGRCQIGLPGRRDQVGALLSCSRSFFLPFRHRDRERAQAVQCPEGVVADMCWWVSRGHVEVAPGMIGVRDTESWVLLSCPPGLECRACLIDAVSG